MGTVPSTPKSRGTRTHPRRPTFQKLLLWMTDRTISATVIVSYYVVVLPSGVRSINESINISISKRHIDISIYRPITKLEPALTGAARLSE